MACLRSALRRTAHHSVAIFSTVFGGCTLAPGEPWGSIDVDLAAQFDPPASRRDTDGRLLTAQSYALALDAVVAHVEALTIKQGNPNGAPIAFDPARPPAGFSLCHNGHCHADDGRLVDYAEVAAEALGTANNTPALRFTADADVQLTDSPTDIEASCGADACLLARGPIVSAALTVTRLRFQGTAFDALDDARLPVEGRAFDITLAPPADIVGNLNASVERFEPVHRTLQTTYALPPSALDAVEFASDIAADGTVSTEAGNAAALNVVEDSVLSTAWLQAP